MESRRRAKRVSYSVGRPAVSDHVLGGLNCIEDVPGVGLVATGGRDGTVRLWNKTITDHTPRMEACLEGHMDWVNDLSWIGNGSDSGGVLASCSSDSQIKIWDIANVDGSVTSSLQLTLSPHADYVRKVKWNPHLQQLVSGSYDGRVALTNIEVASKSGTGSKGVYQFAEVYQSVYSLDTFDNLIAVGTTRPAISLLDNRTGRLEAYLKGHKDMIKGLRFLPSHPHLLTSSSSDGSVKLWDTRRSERALMTISIHNSPVWSLESLTIPMPSDISLLSGSKDGNIFMTLVGYKGSQYSRSASSSLLVSGYSTPILDFKVIPNSYNDSPGLWRVSSSVDQPLVVYDIGVPLSNSVIVGYTPKHLPMSTSPPPAQTPPQRISEVAPLASVSPFTPSPAATDGTVTLHTLVASHLDRHLFSLSPSLRAACSPALKSGDTVATDEDDEKAKCAAVSAALGVAMDVPNTVCKTLSPVVRAKLLDNRRHCVTSDNNNYCQLWDITTGERVLELGEVEEFDKKVTDLTSKYPKVALHSWCSLDVSSGHLVVLLDHPGVFSCYTTLWEKDVSTPLLKSSTPPKLSYSELLLAKSEKPINVGETVLIGLFKKLLKLNVHRYVFDDGTLPLNPQKRSDWWTGELATATSDSQIIRVGFVFPEATQIYLWSLREAGSYTPNRDDVIEVGSSVFAPYDAEPYQKHILCSVSNCDTFLNIPNGPSLPQWVSDMLDERELSLPNSRVANVTFSLKAFGSDLPELPKNSCRLSGSPRIRMHKVAEEVAKILRIKLPTRVSWESLDAASSTSTPSETGGTDPSSPNSTVLPEEYVELLAGGKRIDPLWSLNTVDKTFRGSGSKELVIYYRKCTPD